MSKKKSKTEKPEPVRVLSRDDLAAEAEQFGLTIQLSSRSLGRRIRQRKHLLDAPSPLFENVVRALEDACGF